MSVEPHRSSPASEAEEWAQHEEVLLMGQEDPPMSEMPAVPAEPQPAQRFSRRALLRAGLRAGIGVGAVGALVWLFIPRRQAVLLTPGGQPSASASAGATPVGTASPGATTTPPAGTTPTATPQPTADPQPTATPKPTPTPVPFGQVLLTYRNHTDAVTSVAWSPDGKYLASGGYDASVQVWDTSSGKRLLTYTGHQGYAVNALAWSPNGRQVASGGANNAQIWDAATGARAATFAGHNGTGVGCLAWSPNGLALAAGDGANTVQVWAMPAGTLLLNYRHVESLGVTAVGWSRDGQRLASASPSSIQVWLVKPGDSATLHMWQTSIDVLTWAPGPRLATAFGQQIILWNETSGQALQTLPSRVQLGVTALAWSRDGQRLAWGGEKGEGVQVRSVAGASTVSALKGKTVWSVAWSPDGKRLACGIIDGTVLILSA